MRWNFSSSVHKRMSSKELTNVVGSHGGSGGGNGSSDRFLNGTGQETTSPSWRLPLPHVFVATISSFIFGYHIGVVNEPLESISLDLGFGGNTMAEVKKLLKTCIFSATTTNLPGMLLGRFLVGIGMGLGPPVASLYITEVSPASVRGTYGSFIQIATCLGLIGAFFIGIPVKQIMGWWRVCFWVSAIPPALLAFFMEFCAESPHWLYKRGRMAEVESEFERLLGRAHVELAMRELSRSGGDDAESVRFSELIYGRHFRVVFIGATLFALQQLSGINAVFYFSSAVFKNAGVPSGLANMCVGFANLTGSIIAMLLMDKLGRKVLLLGSFSGMAIAMVLQATASSFHGSHPWNLYISVLGMLMFVLAFALGAGPVPGLLLPEIFPNRIRAKAMAVCMCVHWVVNFFVGLLFLRLLEQLGPHFLYSMFASACLIATVFVKRNVVETKGKSLQEIEISLLPQE